MSRRNADAFEDAKQSPYIFSSPVPANLCLSELIIEEALKKLGPENVVEGMNATADSFYSSQVHVIHALAEIHIELVLVYMENLNLFLTADVYNLFLGKKCIGELFLHG